MQANEIELIEINDKYLDEVWKLKEELLNMDYKDEDLFAGCGDLSESNTKEEYLEKCNLRRNVDYCNKNNLVPSSIYLAIRKNDNRLVGIIDLRYHIEHPILKTWGGHIGYTVRPSERHKGYGKEMLRLDILKAKEHNICKLLVTCSSNNLASEKVILANGGIYESSIKVDEDIVKRYWILVK